MDSDLRQTLAASFGAGGADYDRLRPGYPDEAVDRLVRGIPTGGRVADLGAGTGKLTALLATRGFDVVAVDPSRDMLDQLAGRLPAVEVRIGSGEATGLPDGSVDLATFAQSWHWVEPTAGAAELVRVLRPGGAVGMVWNFVDVAVPWAAELAAAWHSLASEEAIDATRHRPELGSGFGPVESATVGWQDRMEITDLAAVVTTRSYYLTAATAEQDEIRARVAEVLTRHFPAGGVVALPYRTHVFRATRR